MRHSALKAVFLDLHPQILANKVGLSASESEIFFRPYMQGIDEREFVGLFVSLDAVDVPEARRQIRGYHGRSPFRPYENAAARANSLHNLSHHADVLCVKVRKVWEAHAFFPWEHCCAD